MVLILQESYWIFSVWDVLPFFCFFFPNSVLFWIDLIIFGGNGCENCFVFPFSDRFFSSPLISKNQHHFTRVDTTSHHPLMKQAPSCFSGSIKPFWLYVSWHLWMSSVVMMRRTILLACLWALLESATTTTHAWSCSNNSNSRRDWLRQTAAVVLTTTPASSAWAAPDCFQDCIKNCKLIAPKDPAYCNQNCRDYCEQPDRTGESKKKREGDERARRWLDHVLL